MIIITALFDRRSNQFFALKWISYHFTLLYPYVYLQDESGEHYRAIMAISFVNTVLVIFTCTFSLLKALNCSCYVVLNISFNNPQIALNYCIFPSQSITYFNHSLVAIKIESSLCGTGQCINLYSDVNLYTSVFKGILTIHVVFWR